MALGTSHSSATAVVIDLYSRRLLGFAIADTAGAELVCDALRMAVTVRAGPDAVEGAIFYSDRGTQSSTRPVEFTGLCEHFGNHPVDDLRVVSRLRGSLVSEVLDSERIPDVVVPGGLTLVMTDLVSRR